jgi:hypothetical protein
MGAKVKAALIFKAETHVASLVVGPPSARKRPCF